MRQSATLAELVFVQREIQRRVLHVKLRVTRSDFAWFELQQLLVKLDAAFHVANIKGQMGFQGPHCIGSHLSLCSSFFFYIRLAVYAKRSMLQDWTYVKPYIHHSSKLWERGIERLRQHFVVAHGGVFVEGSEP